MLTWTKREHVPPSPLEAVPVGAKELFEIVEMRSLVVDYFDRFAEGLRSVAGDVEGSWTIGMLHDGRSAQPGSTPADVSTCQGSLAVSPVVLVVTDASLVLFDEASAEIVAVLAWERMCRVDLKPVDDGEYQIVAFSTFTGQETVGERFTTATAAEPEPLGGSEFAVLYLYLHAIPSTFAAIDRYWRDRHIPQELHRIPALLQS